MQPVQRGDHIGVVLLSCSIRQLEESVAGDGNEMRGIVDVDFLTLVESVDGILRCLFIPFLSLRSSPEEHIVRAHTHRLKLAGLRWSILADEFHLRLQGWHAPIELAQHRGIVTRIVDGCLGIPQHSALDGRQLLVESVLGLLLVLLRLLRVGSLHRTLDVLSYI